MKIMFRISLESVLLKKYIIPEVQPRAPPTTGYWTLDTGRGSKSGVFCIRIIFSQWASKFFLRN